MEDRERLIELLGHLEYQYTQSHSIMTENVADYLIQKGVTVQRWIPATEPPKEDGDYIILFKDFDGKLRMDFAIFTNNLMKRAKSFFPNEDRPGFCLVDEFGVYEPDVKYWRPLPELPKEME